MAKSQLYCFRNVSLPLSSPCLCPSLLQNGPCHGLWELVPVPFLGVGSNSPWLPITRGRKPVPRRETSRRPCLPLFALANLPASLDFPHRVQTAALLPSRGASEHAVPCGLNAVSALHSSLALTRVLSCVCPPPVCPCALVSASQRQGKFLCLSVILVSAA